MRTRMSFFKFGKNKDGDPHASSPAGLHGGADRAQEAILIEEKKDMIKGIEDLSNTSVKEVMIPRIERDKINVDTGNHDFLD